jgi:hypothetical protein
MVLSNVLQVLGKEPRFQEFKNLRSLLLDRCDLSDDFKTLVFFLRGSPILEKLTLRRCEVYCCLVFNLINKHSALSYIFYAGYSSQNVLAKRNECPYVTVSHLLSFVDWICCVRTSRLKSYIMMAMDPTLSGFCSAFQWICRRTTLNSPKLVSVFVIPGLLCSFSPNGSCGIYVHIIGLIQMH